MKSIFNIDFNTKKAQMISALLLTSILSVSGNISLVEAASTTRGKISTETAETTEIQDSGANKSFKRLFGKKGLSKRVSRAVINDISRRGRINSRAIRIINYTPQNWRNGCLELPRPNEACSQAFVRGWKVVASNGRYNWVYHTNRNGRMVRFARRYRATNNQTSNLPNNLKNRILRAASRQLRQPISRLRIVESEKKQWQDSCLGIAIPYQACLRTTVRGWRVVVAQFKGRTGQTLVYHATADGSRIVLNERASGIADGTLPQQIKDAVLRDASRWSRISQRRLRIVNVESKNWNNPCKLTFDRYCNFAFIPTPGWEVTVDSGTQKWVYHVNKNASIVALDRSRSLSSPAAIAIKKDALRRSRNRRNKDLRVIQVKSLRNWNGNYRNGRGWEATVSNGRESWVYKVKQDGSRFRLVKNNGNDVAVVDNLPDSIVREVLKDARGRIRARISPTPRNIVESRKIRWSDTCLGIRVRGRYCALRVVEGWRVTVKVAGETLVYHTDNRSRVKFNAAASNLNGDVGDSKAVPIPRAELPRALSSNVVFRQISSGGFAGRSYELLLFRDGRLMLSRMGNINDSERKVWRVSSSKVRDFRRLLRRERGEFDNLRYPTSRGSADYRTHVLTTSRGSVEYTDVSRQNLPEDLKLVVQEWRELIRSVR
ncbi:MAG: hypothetical protein AAF378_16030 [Cyanobacteria bacterium P01_A01_bin.84]